MSSQVISETSNEGENGFNFEQWITDNALQDIQSLFIKHNATTSKKLTLVSVEIQTLMTDPELLAKPQMIPKIMSGIHNISTYVITIILSQEEQNVMDTIKQNLKSLEETEHELNKLKHEYPKSKQNVDNRKLEQIKKTKTKINEIFDNLFNALNKRKQALVDQLNVLSLDKNNYNNNDCKDDDEKEIDVISLCQQNIVNSRKYLKEKEKQYNNLISTNKNKSERKNNVLNMGQNVKNEFNETQNILNKNMEIINQKIEQNNQCKVNIDYIINDILYNQANDIIGNLGNIMNKYNMKNAINWTWIPKAPPIYRTSYFYTVSNNSKTVAKTRNDNEVVMIRMDPWFSTNNNQDKLVKAFLNVDAMNYDAVDKHYAIGVITKSYWDSGLYLSSGDKTNHTWRFEGGIYIGATKQAGMSKISSVNQIIGVEINFENNTVGYTLFNNGNRNDAVDCTTTKFNAMENEEICIAISIRNSGWKFTIIE
eukprot:366540_1